MNRATAIVVLAALATLSAVALAAPWPLAAALAGAALASGPRRRAILAFTLASITLQGLALGAFLDGPGPEVLGATLSASGLRAGAIGGLRLAALLAVNLAVLGRFRPAPLAEALPLPVRAKALVAAIALGTQDAAVQARWLVDAQRLDGAWPRGVRRVPAAARLFGPALVGMLHRAHQRRDALRLAGHGTGPGFAPLVAVTALACAARLATTAVPHANLAYVTVFLGGLCFGWRVGVLAGLLTMALTNIAISGLFLPAFANAPAMALVGLCGALLRPLGLADGDRGDRVVGRVLAACAGFALTLLFSITSDLASWVLVPEYREPGALQVLLLLGLAFNLGPALLNSAVFALAVVPVARAVSSSAARPTPSRPS